MTEERTYEPLYFTMYFDKDFKPDDDFLNAKMVTVEKIFKQKINEQGLKESEYDDVEMMCVGDRALLTLVVNAGNLWKDIVNCVRFARFPKGWHGDRQFKTDKKTIKEEDVEGIDIPILGRSAKDETLQ